MSKRCARGGGRSPAAHNEGSVAQSAHTPWRPVLAGIAVLAIAGWWYAGRSPAPIDSLSSEVQPTIANAVAPAIAPPEGMVWIPGGEFSMGAAERMGMNHVGMQATLDSRPFHRVHVDGFWMDATEVTNDQFSRFVEATGY